MSLSKVVEKIRSLAAELGEKLEPGASQSEVFELAERVWMEFGVTVPQEYLQFLRIVDGLEYNGLIIYGTKNSTLDPEASQLDLSEMNRIAREVPRVELRDCLLIGETSTGLLAFDGATGCFQYRDRIGVDRVESYPSFELLLTEEIARIS